MEKIFEFIMLACFCIAEIILLNRFIKQKSLNLWLDRITAITMGIGFLVGLVAKILTNSADWILMFYVFGIYLSYAGIVFSFQKDEENS